MSQTAITKRITTVSEAEKQFNLVRTADLNFFSECREKLPDGSLVPSVIRFSNHQKQQIIVIENFQSY
jgi:hypothetical protein